jgi:CHAP domain
LALLSASGLAACSAPSDLAKSEDSRRDSGNDPTDWADAMQRDPRDPLPRSDGADTGEEASTGEAKAAAPACPCYDGDGAYCGRGALSYTSEHACAVPDLAANTGNVYACDDGHWSVRTNCASGCYVAPAGTPDGCVASCDGLSLSDFIAKFTGVCTGAPGWSPPNQCTDLAAQWVANLCLPVQFAGDAVNWAGESVEGFTWVENTGKLVPSPGDLVVFGPADATCAEGVGSDGHVDICVSASASDDSWTGFDQNWQTDWNGTCYPPQQVTHNWGECVIGWQHLTVPIP